VKRPFFFLAIFLSILIILFRFFEKEDKFSAGHIANFTSDNPRHLAVKGKVASNPFYRYNYFKKAQSFIVNPSLVKVSKVWFPAYGNIQITSYNNKEVRYGDDVLFEAKLKLPSSGGGDSFDYRRHLARVDIFALATISEKEPIIITGNKASLLKSLVYNSKDLFKRSLEKLFRRPERFFLSAVLLGERQDIPKEWKGIFVKTQTMHLLAISGLHVGIIAFMIFFLIGLLRAPRDFRYIITILLLLFYSLIVGGRPSVVRATVMGIVILGSYLLKRDADIYNSLGLSAVAILMFNPDQLFNYGFILSFVAVLSIVYLTPRINRIFRIDHSRLGGIRYYFLTLASASLAVWLGLLPLTVNFFDIISPISVFVNILAIPLLFIIIALSVVSLIFYPIFFLGLIFAEAAEFFIAILLLLLRFFSRLPLAYLEVKPVPFYIVLLYYFLLIIAVERNRVKRFLLDRTF
jgi:competence protein ComEC